MPVSDQPKTVLVAGATGRLGMLVGLMLARDAELAGDVAMEQSAVSQQLRVLRHLGLVVGERDGRQVIYALYDDHVRALLAEAVSHTEHLRLGPAASPTTVELSA
jgi:ArsR family transcriptional regulator, nickel/cobalt-responsive transcriptional repressor